MCASCDNRHDDRHGAPSSFGQKGEARTERDSHDADRYQIGAGTEARLERSAELLLLDIHNRGEDERPRDSYQCVIAMPSAHAHGAAAPAMTQRPPAPSTSSEGRRDDSWRVTTARS